MFRSRESASIALRRKAHFRLVSFFIALLSNNSIFQPCDTAQAEPVRTRIIDGTPVPESSYPNVARLTYQGDLLCTGTLVGTRYILTAAHCFFNENNQREVGDSAVTARLGDGQSYTSSKVYINPAYRSRSSACVEGETDAAIIELASDVTGVTPAALLDSALPLGATLTLAGYGTLGSGSSGENGSIPDAGTIYVGSTVVEGFGENPPQQNPDSSYIYWQFDSGEANTASGDSGGPAFYQAGAETYIAAITCGGEGNAQIGTYSFDTRVDLMAGWIRSITGTTPANTPPSFSTLAPQAGMLGTHFSFAVPVGGSQPLQLNATGLPDGLTLSGTTISGTPTVKGTYTVQLTATNDFGSATTDLVIVVTGFEPSVTISKVLLQFDDTNDSDFLDIDGKITVGPKFNPRGKKVIITIGRFSKQFRLDLNGQSTGNGRSFIDLVGRLRGKTFRSSTVRYNLTFERVALFNELSTLGFADSDNAIDGQQVELPLTISINGVEASSTVTLRFRESDSRWRIAPAS